MSVKLQWRSLLYVPAHQERVIAGAHSRNADAIILDLEDGVPPDDKSAARTALAGALPRVAAAGADVLVRINRLWALAWRDLEAAVQAGARMIVLPKVEDECQVRGISEYLDELEGVGARSVRIIAIIESALGLARAGEIAMASPRLYALIPGNEDLAADLGFEPAPERMLHTHMPLLLHARAAKLRVYGTFGGSANISDLDAYRERVQLSRSWGLDGVTCIHPAQVAVINEVYLPSSAETDHARRLVAAFEEVGGSPIAFEGKMVDRPVYLRAQQILKLDSGE